MTEENNSGRVNPDVPEFSQQPPPPTGAPEEQAPEPARTGHPGPDQAGPDQPGLDQAGPDQAVPPQPPLEQAPASPPAPGAGPAPSAPVQPQPWTPTSQAAAGEQWQQPQSPPPSEGTWSPPPPGEESMPSPEEDAALREQRARRFGADAESTEASDETATTQLPSEQPASPFPPVVTPIPASPHTSSYGTGTTQQFPVGPGQYPGAHPAPGHPAHAHPRPDDDFEGLREAPASRAAAHWWTILISLVFIPVAWYLVTDAGARIEWFLSQGQPVTVAAYLELGLGLLAVFIFLLAARWSSVGSIVMGAIFLALGIAFLIFPAEGTNLLTQSTEYFGRLGQFGINVVEHLSETLTTGRMTVYGLTLIMVGVVSHGARRQGRREERTKIALGE